MKIPTWEQLLCLFPRMMSCLDAPACRAPGLVGPVIVHFDHGRAAKGCQEMRQVFHPLSNEMNYRAVTLDTAGDADQPSSDHRLAECLVDFAPDHDV